MTKVRCFLWSLAIQRLLLHGSPGVVQGLVVHVRSTTRAHSPSCALALSSSSDEDVSAMDSLRHHFGLEAREVLACLRIVVEPFLARNASLLSESEITLAILRTSDLLDALSTTPLATATKMPSSSSFGSGVQRKDKDGDDLSSAVVGHHHLFVNQRLELRRRSLEFQRHEWLCRLLRANYDAYVETASFLSPSRIPRSQLPNVQDVPMMRSQPSAAAVTTATIKDETTGELLVPDCELEAVEYRDTPLDRLLLGIFRGLVEQNTGGVTSDKPGIAGLLDQGRTFMLLPGQTPEAQHKMVRDTLGGLMTPALPPFYRIFMAGIVPSLGTKWDGQQIGPWFYAPWLTSVFTPPFFRFLVGPSRPNRRKDGQPGGLLVEKCKFLQESNCKGLCLHQCKLPAQQFFAEELGLALSVSPNFVTQECQWSFGEIPLEPADDPSFPAGCLAGCESRRLLAASRQGTAANGSKQGYLCS